MMCVICKKEIDKQYNEDGKMYWDQGNDAMPVANGRCCNKCDKNIVLPMRFTDMQMSLLNGGKNE
tara:strand:+ start:94 stop:288 length:195 start_codon:yes stop_codon:yes gene_type:complete